MFYRTCIILVIVCVGGGIVTHCSFAESSNPARDLFSAFRSYQTPVVRNDAETNSSVALSQHRLALSYSEQNDIAKANAHYGLALQNATPKQIPSIASDYASFLLRTGDYHKAELILRQALAQSPNNEEFTRMLARCLVLQDKMMEGLRYLKSLGSESEAREEIAAIYREQGNGDMLAAIEKKWGVTGGVSRPKSDSSEPVLFATTSKPLSALPPVPMPMLNTKTATQTATTAISPKKSVPAVAPRKTPALEDVDAVAATPIAQPLARSKFFDTKVPIPVPVPNSDPQPMVAITRLPRSVSSAPVPKLPAPQPATSYSAAEKLALDEIVLVNPVKLPTATASVLAQTEAKELTRPAIASQTRRHYITNASVSTNMDALFTVKPTSATMPVR